MNNIYPDNSSDRANIRYVQAKILGSDLIPKTTSTSGRATTARSEEELDDGSLTFANIFNLDGGFAACKYLMIQMIDGGAADSVYLPSQIINGGEALWPV